MLPRSTPTAQLETFRQYLRMLARLRIPADLQQKVDSSDLVQETLLRAHNCWGQFRGESDEDLAAWLRSILSRQLADAIRRFHADKRDAGLEISLEKALEESAHRLEQVLASEGSGPVEHTIRQEDLLKLSAALAQLPDDHREALEYRYFEALSVDDIARRMKRSRPAVAGLLRRGMRRLREILGEPV